MSTEEAGEVVFTLIAAAVARDGDKACELLDELTLDSDAHRMYGINCAIATAGQNALCLLFGDRAPDIERGGQWNIEQLKPGGLDDPAQAFSARFLIAHSNGQTETARAHYETLLKAGPQAYVDGVSRLLSDVAGLCRTALEQHEAGGG